MDKQWNNSHITRLGSPLTRAFYCASDQDGLVQMDVDIRLAQLQAKGVVVTPDTVTEVKSNVERARAQYHEKVSQLGIPEKVKELFAITKKAKAIQHCQTIVLSEYELFLLIHNCGEINYAHRSKFRQYVPDHLRVSDADRAKMKSGYPKVFIKKVDSTLLEHRYIHVHLFDYGPYWHCFYFSHQDIEPKEINHWKAGASPHLHYISYLWPDLKKRLVWNAFNQRSTNINGSVHIRFEPFEFLQPDEATDRYVNRGLLPPWTVIFDPNLAGGCGLIPLPVPHLATRGKWMVTFSLRPKSS